MDIGSVSTLNIVSMVIEAVLSVLVPIAAIVILGIRKRMKWKSLLFGALLFIVFALILETILHSIVLGADPTNSPVYQNKWLYMVYAGFAAGIFEETARLLGFKFLIRVSEKDGIDTGISYGLGHGGIESIIFGGFPAFSNIMMASMHNSGSLNSLRDTLTGEQLQSLNEGIEVLISTPSHMFLMAGFERLVALVLQISLSLFVLKAVSQKKWLYFLYAVLIHAAVDMFAVYCGLGGITNIFLVEGILAAAAAVVAFVTFRVCYGRENDQTS